MKDVSSAALAYHRQSPPGKLSIVPSKPCKTQEDLSLAYTPGVAAPCLEIQKDPEASYLYTSRGNTVAVITDGTAVLGLGNIGALAGMPVMEGKCVLLHRFAGINGIPLGIQTRSVRECVRTIAPLEPSFGAIILEDIGAPECFRIEEQLKEMMGIPVFHDDQHGTAVVALAALLGSVGVTGKKLDTIRIVVNGAGAAGIAVSNLLVDAGIQKEQMLLVDSHGVVSTGRTEGMNRYKRAFARRTQARTLTEALQGADVFIGISAGNVLSSSQVRGMADQAIVLAMANPTPEILPADALRGGAAIAASGRSDFPNQVNNALGFPGIFRAVLDARVTTITKEMKLAAAHALYKLACVSIPDRIQESFAQVYPAQYAARVFSPKRPLSRDYIIPKLFDPRVVPAVARAVAEAAQESGIAKDPIPDPDAYERELLRRLST